MKRIIITMVAVWLVVMAAMLFSDTVRTRYWGWRLARAEGRAEQDYYASRLARRADHAVGAAAKLLGHADPNIRLLAVLAMDQASGDEPVDPLLTGLMDEEVEIRHAAALAVGTRANPDVIGRLSRMAAGDDPAVATAAVFALQRAASKEAVDAMIRVLETTDSVEVRVQTIESLGLLGIERARPVLTRMLQDTRRVTTMPANERAMWRGFLAQRHRLGPPALAVTQPAPEGGKTVREYAADALRQLRRAPITASRPAS